MIHGRKCCTCIGTLRYGNLWHGSDTMYSWLIATSARIIDNLSININVEKNRHLSEFILNKLTEREMCGWVYTWSRWSLNSQGFHPRHFNPEKCQHAIRTDLARVFTGALICILCIILVYVMYNRGKIRNFHFFKSMDEKFLSCVRVREWINWINHLYLLQDWKGNSKCHILFHTLKWK